MQNFNKPSEGDYLLERIVQHDDMHVKIDKLYLKIQGGRFIGSKPCFNNFTEEKEYSVEIDNVEFRKDQALVWFAGSFLGLLYDIIYEIKAVVT